MNTALGVALGPAVRSVTPVSESAPELVPGAGLWWALAVLLPAGVALALALAGILPAPHDRRWRRRLVALAPLATVPMAVVAILGERVGTADVPWLLLGTELEIGRIGGPLVLMATVLYAAALASVQVSGTERPSGLSGLLLLAFVGNSVVFIARDVVTFYLSFTLVTFVGFAVVIHDRTAEARRAGRIYLVLGVTGEAAVLAGIMLVARDGGRFLDDVPAVVAGSPNSGLIVALLLAGFGVKAGSVPLHVWLPLAHPAAPIPASAVLSGAMIVAGLAGWLRFLPLGEVAMPVAGTVAVVLGLAGALLAAPVGVLQRKTKTVLAYSSISQMGLIGALIGVGLIAPGLAPACGAAAVMYAVHHGVAKAALFLGLGLRQRAWELADGRWRRWSGRVVTAGMVIAGTSLAGLPLTSGYLAKYAAKEAVGEAVILGVAVAGILPLVGVGSTVLLARLAWLLRAETLDRREAARDDEEIPEQERHGWASFVAVAVWGAMILAGPVLTLVLAGSWTIAVPGLVDASAWWDSSWPVLVGLALTGIVVAALRGGRWPSRLRTGERELVPAGDILAIEEPVARWALRLATRGSEAVRRGRESVEDVIGGWPSAAAGIVRGERRLATWQGSGLAVLAVVVALVAVLWAVGAS